MLPRPQVKCTYSSRPRQFPSSPQSSSSPTTSPSPNPIHRRKRPLADSSILNSLPTKKTKNALELLKSSSSSTKSLNAKSNALKKKKTSLQSTSVKATTQLHFVVNKTLRTCLKCSLSYIKGAVEDETLHKKHCLRVQRGLEWGKEEEREADKAGVRVIEDLLRFKDVNGDIFARIISVPADVGGKIGAKVSSRFSGMNPNVPLIIYEQLSNLFDTINLSLSAPSLTPEALETSKAYLFLLPVPNTTRERIVGCVIAQRIVSAMNVIPEPSKKDEGYIHVDGGLYCR